MVVVMNRAITDYDIQALVDNELGWEEEKRVRNYIDNHAWARRRYDELQEQKQSLHIWFSAKQTRH